MTLRRAPLLALPALVFVAVAVLFYFGMQRDDPDALPSTRTGEAAPALSLAPLGERAPFTREVLDAPGVKLVNFWASWCAPCRVEHSQLMTLSRAGVPIYGINYKDEPAKALGLLAEMGDPFAAVTADREGHTALDWGVYGVPETFVIDGDGKIVLRFAGPITRSVLRNTIRPAIAEAG